MEVLNTLFGSTALLTICVTVLATFAVTLIFKTSYTTNFAQGVISALGAYVTASFVIKIASPEYFGGTGVMPYGVAIAIGLFLGILVGVGAGLFVDTCIIRRGRNVNAIGKQIITMGLVSVIVGVVPLVFSIDKRENKPAFPLIEGGRVLSIGNFTLSLNTIVCVAITAVILIVVFVLLNKSKWGLGVRATASNEQIADMLGVDTYAITAISWAISGGIGAIAGVMMLWQPGVLNSVYMTQIQVNAFLACILGGFSTFFGPVLGAIIICMTSNLVGCVGMYISGVTAWREVIVYFVLLILVLIKPEGLFGQRTVRKV